LVVTGGRDADCVFAEASDEPHERPFSLSRGALGLPEQIGLTGALGGEAMRLEDQGDDRTTLFVRVQRLSEAEAEELHQ
jgi:hypothetical protein